MARSIATRLLRGLLLLLIVGYLLALAAVRLGTPEADAGLRGGQLRPCPDSPNCVLSLPAAQAGEHAVAPLEAAAGFDAAAAAVAAMPGAKVVEREGRYLHAVFVTPLLRYRDDLELHQPDPAGPIHVRSASRIGYSDLGKNRARVEALRAVLEAIRKRGSP